MFVCGSEVIGLSLDGLEWDDAPLSPLFESSCYPSCHVYVFLLFSSEERMVEELSIGRSTGSFFDQTEDQLETSMTRARQLTTWQRNHGHPDCIPMVKLVRDHEQ
jgi:hypothetical protein